jgi:L-alanine-DL-glutamate epimerase-like enolase superfamily enzyme
MNRQRRTFLQTAGLGVAAAPFASPAAVGADKPAKAPGFAPRDLAPGLKELAAHLDKVRVRTGLKVTAIETYTHGTNLGFVRIRTDDGSEGWGQLSPFDADVAALILHRKLARHVLGADPADLDALSDRCIEANYKYPWSFICRALAGIDTALWDLLGKLHKKSVCALLGGKPRPLPVYGSSMRRDIKPADEARRLAKLRDELGFAAFKVRVGKVNGHDQDQWPGRTEALLPAVRKAVGARVALLADANSCYTPARAIAVGRLLEGNGYCHFEEPCPYWELEWTAEVTAAVKVPVAGGEQDNDLAQWRRMIRMNAVDIVQPDVCYVGGLTRALRVARLGALAGKPCVPHSANLSWVTVFTLHLLAALPNAGPYVEFSIERTPWTEGVYDPPLRVKDGKVAVPDGPGWGVKVRPGWLAKATRQVSTRR